MVAGSGHHFGDLIWANLGPTSTKLVRYRPHCWAHVAPIWAQRQGLRPKAGPTRARFQDESRVRQQNCVRCTRCQRNLSLVVWRGNKTGPFVLEVDRGPGRGPKSGEGGSVGDAFCQRRGITHCAGEPRWAPRIATNACNNTLDHCTERQRSFLEGGLNHMSK